MSTDSRGYWRGEVGLIALLFLFFFRVVSLFFPLPLLPPLFPPLLCRPGLPPPPPGAFAEKTGRGAPRRLVVEQGDPAAKADWPRYATALLAAPVFGLMFWLVGFILASLAAMLLIPVLMGYANRRQLVVTALLTVAILALLGPYLLNVDLPHGLVGDWLIDKLAPRAV